MPMNFHNRREKTFANIFDELFIALWALSDAKVCRTCRSRKTLQNENLLANIGLDTAENGLLKVCQM